MLRGLLCSFSQIGSCHRFLAPVFLATLLLNHYLQLEICCTEIDRNNKHLTYL